MKKISKPVAVVVAVSACAIIGIGAVCAAKSTHEVASSEPTMVTEEVSTPEVATPEIAVEETDAVEADAGDESESQDVDVSEEGEATESEETAVSETASEEPTESEPVAVSEEAAEAEPESQAEQEPDPDPEPVVQEEIVVEPEPQQESSSPSAPVSVDGAAQMASRPGMMGRLSIPDVGIDVAVFNSDSPATADAVDSACYFDWLGYPVMGDHQNQGWSALQYCVPGSTLAYFDNGSSVTTYICTDNFTGINTGYGFTYDDGTPISGSSLVLYTCLGSDWTHYLFCYFFPA